LTSEAEDRPVLLFDASVLFTGLTGKGASATLLSTIQLGGMFGCTVENAMEETRIHLVDHFNRGRNKLHASEATRLLKNLRDAPSFDVHPWITPPASLLPENRKDAYLLAAAEQYAPRFLLTWDTALAAIFRHGETMIVTPSMFMEVWDEMDLAP